MSERDETDDQTAASAPRSARGAGGPNDPNGPNGRPSRGGGDDDWDDWDDDDRWGGGRTGSGGGGTDLRLIALLVAAVVAIVAVVLLTRKDDKNQTTGDQTTATTQAGGLCGNWPAALGGAGKNVTEDGVFVWSDFTGIHIRARGSAETIVKVTGDTSYKVKNEDAAFTASAKEGTEVTFTFPAGDGAAGPDLDVSCEVGRLTIEATSGGAPLAADKIHIGDTGRADANPVTYSRDG